MAVIFENVDKIITSDGTEHDLDNMSFGAGALSEMTNASITSPQDGDSLIWDAIAGTWVAESEVSPPPAGEAVFTTAGTFSWTPPVGVESVCVVCVGAGGSGNRIFNGVYGTGGQAGALAYTNNIDIKNISSLLVEVGGTSALYLGPSTSSTCVAKADSFVRVGTGGDGGGANVLQPSRVPMTTGGGGAAGYGPTNWYSKGAYGNTTPLFNTTSNRPTAGNHGGGGGGAGGYNACGGGGGGVGLYGQGANGAGGFEGGVDSTGGGGGSGGSSGGNGSSSIGGNGGNYGGAGGGGLNGSNGGNGGLGAVRIIWGDGRSFPSNAS